MSKVAVFIGSDHETIAFNESGTLCVFLKKENKWDIIQKIPLTLNESMGLSRVREALLQAVKAMNGCKIIVAKKVYGVSYTVFETMQFSIWEVEGQPQTFLDDISAQETSYKKQDQDKSKVNNFTQQMEEGHYVINLQEMQSVNPSISSKQAIIPFLKKGVFKRIDIICSHTPPWIECEVPKYCLKMKTEQISLESYQVTLLSR
ncbi:MAG: Fe-only nitrogenase accessory protein AnfO [Clostridia bacterium]|jgi:Fe-only nitrogenase accessory protein AnfO|nr:Fe-only nitrogenase accessory protein AnfO [Clostridia bacterium]